MKKIMLKIRAGRAVRAIILLAAAADLGDMLKNADILIEG